MALNPSPSLLDQQQILQRVFDKDNDLLRTDTTVHVDTINADLNVAISALDGDSIAIANQAGSNYLAVNTNGSINVTINNTSGSPAVNIQDGGNSITVDGTLGSSQAGIWNVNHISGTISLPTGASTSTLQVTSNSSLSSIDNKTPALVGGRQPIDGSGVTQPVSAVSLPLPSGASTSTLQVTGNTSLSSIDSKLTSPINTFPIQASNAWYATGDVTTSAMTQVNLMKTAYLYTGVNVNPFIASNSANDTLAGSGAQKVTITYFKADGSGPFIEVENMQGVTGFFGGLMAFIQSAVVSQVGSGGTNAGQILMSNLSPLSTMATIAAGDNETYYCHHFVPLGKTAYITSFSFSGTATSAGRGARFIVKKQAIPLASNAQLITLGTMALVGTSSTSQVTLPTPVKVIGPAIIFTYVIPDTATTDTWSAAIGGYEL